MNKLYDLRIVIGIFFLIIGFLLMGYAFFLDGSLEENIKINLYCGLLFLSFGLLMLLLKTKRNRSN
ncbi:hypothetical protein BD847_2713 [Flavobacterium cutihirudinis]|uniref:Uncharacterized protein n=1 Tax=Flavobacterium cutihirudinis TaxID=1265740 RepID=A0A3D9FT38_9FLAO|nr:hypothetical protein [Flavobacterium cutihirudinis]RED23650.1 hypothetical protein BD847_2713 [Flavobacterium cutihirudinis]